MTGGRVQQGQGVDSDTGVWLPLGRAEGAALCLRRDQGRGFLEGVYS